MRYLPASRGRRRQFFDAAQPLGARLLWSIHVTIDAGGSMP